MTYIYFRDLGQRGLIQGSDLIYASQTNYYRPRFVSVSEFLSSSSEYNWLGSPAGRYRYLLEWSQTQHLRIDPALRSFSENAQLNYHSQQATPNEGGSIFSPLGAGVSFYAGGQNQSFNLTDPTPFALGEVFPENRLNANRLDQMIVDPANIDAYLARCPAPTRYSYLYWAAHYNFNVLRFTQSQRQDALTFWHEMTQNLRTRFPDVTQYTSADQLVQQLSSLGIQRAHRFYTISSVLTLLSNGSLFQPRASTPKPVLIIAMAQDDWNGGFADGSLSKAIDAYSEHYKIFYQENDQERNIQQTLNAGLNIHPAEVHYTFIIGHGNPYSIEFTSHSPNETHHLDEEDLRNGEINFRGYAAAFFIACSTGRSLVRTAAENNRGTQFSGPNRDFFEVPSFGLNRNGSPLITYERGVASTTLSFPPT